MHALGADLLQDERQGLMQEFTAVILMYLGFLQRFHDRSKLVLRRKEQRVVPLVVLFGRICTHLQQRLDRPELALLVRVHNTPRVRGPRWQRGVHSAPQQMSVPSPAHPGAQCSAQRALAESLL